MGALLGVPASHLGRSAARLRVIRETTDGVRIAEEDLNLRGEGDVLGTRQNGLPRYRIARSEVHGQLITQARDEALRILKDNPKLTGQSGEALRCLLYQYERDEALPLCSAPDEPFTSAPRNVDAMLAA
jgi:ATP-dependent DNA helicase RecG